MSSSSSTSNPVSLYASSAQTGRGGVRDPRADEPCAPPFSPTSGAQSAQSCSGKRARRPPHARRAPSGSGAGGLLPPEVRLHTKRSAATRAERGRKHTRARARCCCCSCWSTGCAQKGIDVLDRSRTRTRQRLLLRSPPAPAQPQRRGGPASPGSPRRHRRLRAGERTRAHKRRRGRATRAPPWHRRRRGPHRRRASPRCSSRRCSAPCAAPAGCLGGACASMFTFARPACAACPPRQPGLSRVKAGQRPQPMASGTSVKPHSSSARTRGLPLPCSRAPPHRASICPVMHAASRTTQHITYCAALASASCHRSTHDRGAPPRHAPQSARPEGCTIEEMRP